MKENRYTHISQTSVEAGGRLLARQSQIQLCPSLNHSGERFSGIVEGLKRPARNEQGRSLRQIRGKAVRTAIRYFCRQSYKPEELERRLAGFILFALPKALTKEVCNDIEVD